MLLIGSRIVTRSTPILGRAATRGWCPGVLDPMETGDGWLLRMRLPGGVIDIAQLRVVGAVAAEHGSGQVDITSRGNLQIRGVSADRIERAGDELVHAGLALPDAATDARRAVVASPLAGHDGTALSDSQIVVHDWLSTEWSGMLPSKFGVVVDDGGRWDLSGVDADVRVVAVGDGWSVQLRGASEAAGWTADPVAVVQRAATLCADRAQRMNAIVAERGSEAVLAQLGVERRPALKPMRPTGDRLLGIVDHPEAARRNVLAAPFLGRIDASTIAQLANLVDGHGAAIRFTPDHSIALCGASAANAGDLVEQLSELNFAVSATDPRSDLSACVGSRGCSSAFADTWLAAEQMARAVPSAGRVHLSACAKACGAPAGVHHLVATTNGSFR